MKSKYDHDAIRDYLHGLVDQGTAQRIRELIRNDEIARNIASGILQLEHEFNGNDEEVEAYIEDLRQKQLKLIGENTVKVRTFKPWMRAAAAILLVAMASAVALLMLPGKNTGEMLTEELSTPYPLAVLERDASGGSAADEAYLLYQRGDYANAVAAFERISTTKDVSMTFYDGMSNLYAGNYDRAAALLDMVSTPDGRYIEQALWFQSLALLKGGRIDEAKKIIREISSHLDKYKSEEAAQLLKTMD